MASMNKVFGAMKNALSVGNFTLVGLVQLLQNYTAELEKAEGGGGGGATDADEISYDNTASGLAGDNVQEAIDEVVDDIGDLSDLETTDKSDIVSAINEVNGITDDLQTAISGAVEDIGDLSDLETTTKTDLVSAINEVASGSGGSFTRELLYNKGENNNFPSTITMAHPYTDYDYIEFVTYKDDDGGNTDILDLKVFSKAMFDLALNNTIGSKNNSIMIIGDPHNGAQYARYDVSSSTTLSAGWTNGNWAIYQIYGVKH